MLDTRCVEWTRHDTYSSLLTDCVKTTVQKLQYCRHQTPDTSERC